MLPSLLYNLTRMKCHSIISNTRAVFFSTSDRASKEVLNTREPDLRVARLRSSPTTTSAVVGSNASVVAEVRAREHGRYD